MKFSVTIDRDEDGIWIVECPSIPGCVSQGMTKNEALSNIEEAIQLCQEVRAEIGAGVRLGSLAGRGYRIPNDFNEPLDDLNDR